MQDARFHDATLLVLAHGSTVNVGSAAPARMQAAALRAQGIFAAVHECYWQQAPYLGAVLDSVRTARTFIVPLFIGEGYFVEEVIPRALGLKQEETGGFRRHWRRGALDCHYCRPVGTHPTMTEVLLARARDVVIRHPFPRSPCPTETALVVVGHGTERTSASRTAVEEQVRIIRDRRLYAEVHAGFMETAPWITDCYAITQARHLLVLPFFISDGLHVVEDIPVLLGESKAVVRCRLETGRSTWRNPTERQGKLVWYAAGIGREPLLARVILQRVVEAVTDAAP